MSEDLCFLSAVELRGRACRSQRDLDRHPRGERDPPLLQFVRDRGRVVTRLQARVDREGSRSRGPGGALLNYRDAKRERAAIKSAFGYFLPDTVVEQLARNVGPVTANNQLVYGACLATDAEQYTALAEKMDPTELGRLMNEYYKGLFESVSQRGGIVSDVIGDAMLAIWASSSADPSLRRQACDAALDAARATGKRVDATTCACLPGRRAPLEHPPSGGRREPRTGTPLRTRGIARTVP